MSRDSCPRSILVAKPSLATGKLPISNGYCATDYRKGTGNGELCLFDIKIAQKGNLGLKIGYFRCSIEAFSDR